MRLVFNILLCCLNCCFLLSNANKNNEQESTRILFGSCNKQYLEQPLWPHIQSRNPDVWIWSGDIVYQDRPNISCLSASYNYLFDKSKDDYYFHCNRIGFGPMKPNNYDYFYNVQLNNPYYQKLLNTTKIIGIWDDHDYGQNDGDYSNPWKNAAKQSLMKFLKISPNDPIRNRDGMYSFHTFKFGKNNNLMIDVYLLDIRWFSDSKNNILFGEQQWKWLKNKITERLLLKPNISLFVSGVQILPFYRGYYSEAWSGKSNIDRVKFIEYLLNKNVSSPILISGDVHWGEIMQYVCKNKKESIYKSLFEITSSGLTHSWSYTYPKYWVFLKNMVHSISADGATIALTNDLNFGEIEVIYSNDNNINNIYLRVYGINGVLLEIDLMDKKYQNVDLEKSQIIIEQHKNEKRNNMKNQQWICVGYNEHRWSKFYLIMNKLIIFAGVGSVLFLISGGCFGCFCFFCCCCKCYCCKKSSTKIKQS